MEHETRAQLIERIKALEKLHHTHAVVVVDDSVCCGATSCVKVDDSAALKHAADEIEHALNAQVEAARVHAEAMEQAARVQAEAMEQAARAESDAIRMANESMEQAVLAEAEALEVSRLEKLRLKV